MDKKKTSIAVVLPIANERDRLRDTLGHLLSLGAEEILVVDGGSTDGSGDILEGYPAVRHLRMAAPNRALQMNQGGMQATGDVLVFVHADMRLGPESLRRIRQKIEKGYVGGGFCKRYDANNLLLSIYGICLNVFYLRTMRCLVGTNAIFVRRDVFERMHGFREEDFLEDVLFSADLKKHGRIAVIPSPVTVSARRYLHAGIMRQILRNCRILLGHMLLGETPGSLREKYESGSHAA